MDNDAGSWNPAHRRSILKEAIRQKRFIRFSYSKKGDEGWSVRVAWPRNLRGNKLNADDVTPGKTPGYKAFIAERMSYIEILPTDWTPLALAGGMFGSSPMALVQCPECRRTVSSLAESCPNCGCPLAGRPDVVGGRQVRTIEKTAKRYKSQLALSFVGLVGSLIWVIAQPCLPASLLAAVFLFWFLLVKVAIWWHHG